MAYELSRRLQYDLDEGGLEKHASDELQHVRKATMPRHVVVVLKYLSGSNHVRRRVSDEGRHLQLHQKQGVA